MLGERPRVGREQGIHVAVPHARHDRRRRVAHFRCIATAWSNRSGQLAGMGGRRDLPAQVQQLPHRLESMAGREAARAGVGAVRPEQQVTPGVDEQAVEHGASVTVAPGIRVDDELGFGHRTVRRVSNRAHGGGHVVEPDHLAGAGREFGQRSVRERWMPVRRPSAGDQPREPGVHASVRRTTLASSRVRTARPAVTSTPVRCTRLTLATRPHCGSALSSRLRGLASTARRRRRKR